MHTFVQTSINSHKSTMRLDLTACGTGHSQLAVARTRTRRPWCNLRCDFVTSNEANLTLPKTIAQAQLLAAVQIYISVKKRAKRGCSELRRLNLTYPLESNVCTFAASHGYDTFVISCYHVWPTAYLDSVSMIKSFYFDSEWLFGLLCCFHSGRWRERNHYLQRQTHRKQLSLKQVKDEGGFHKQTWQRR